MISCCADPDRGALRFEQLRHGIIPAVADRERAQSRRMVARYCAALETAYDVKIIQGDFEPVERWWPTYWKELTGGDRLALRPVSGVVPDERAVRSNGLQALNYLQSLWRRV